MQKDVASNAALHEEVDKLRSWKESKAKEIKELMEQVGRSVGIRFRLIAECRQMQCCRR